MPDSRIIVMICFLLPGNVNGRLISSDVFLNDGFKVGALGNEVSVLSYTHVGKMGKNFVLLPAHRGDIRCKDMNYCNNLHYRKNHVHSHQTNGNIGSTQPDFILPE